MELLRLDDESETRGDLFGPRKTRGRFRPGPREYSLMLTQLPICASPDAYRLLASQLPVINSPDALLQGAVAVAMHQIPGANPTKVDTLIQKYVDVIRARVRGSQPQALWAHMHEYL